MSELKQPNTELICKYINSTKDFSKFDFKLMNEALKAFDSSLERELFFKRESTKVPDPDCCELTMSIMCILLRKNGIDVKGYEGRYIYLSGENIDVIETDTANSFISLYKGALMQNVPNYFQLCDKYNITGSFTSEYEKIYAHRDEFSLKGYDDTLLTQFEEFANLTHSIGNFVLGPKGFNTKDPKAKGKIMMRDWKQFDRMDIFLEKVANRQTYNSWETWYEKNCFSTYTNYFYSNIVNYPETDIVNLKESTIINLGNENLAERIRLINTIILSRGKQMVQDLIEIL